MRGTADAVQARTRARVLYGDYTLGVKPSISII